MEKERRKETGPNRERDQPEVGNVLAASDHPLLKKKKKKLRATVDKALKW